MSVYVVNLTISIDCDDEDMFFGKMVVWRMDFHFPDPLHHTRCTVDTIRSRP